jgi:hypothetical protein
MTVQKTLDKEFKLFCKHRGVNVSSGLFELSFSEPQSFSKYREIEIDQQRANLFGTLEGAGYLSKRFILSRYLGLTEEEVLNNERLWAEENDPDSAPAGDAIGDLSSVGVRSGDMESFAPTDVEAENDTGELDLDAPADTPDTGDTGGTPNEV